MSQDLTDDKSTLVQVKAWSHQVTSHYLSQCWLSSMSSYGITRPQWVMWIYVSFRSIFVQLFLFSRYLLIDINWCTVQHTATQFQSWNVGQTLNKNTVYLPNCVSLHVIFKLNDSVTVKYVKFTISWFLAKIWSLCTGLVTKCCDSTFLSYPHILTKWLVKLV